MPRRETRYDIERALSVHRHKLRTLGVDAERKLRAEIERKTADMHKRLSQDKLAEARAASERRVNKVSVQVRRMRRRPGEGSMPALVEPPRGPKPLAGGAAAPLEFD